MLNPWIAHVRRFAEQKGVTYACALSDPTIKSGYVRQSKPTVVKAPKAVPVPKVKKEKAPKAVPVPKVKKEKAPKAEADGVSAAKLAREALKKISADEKQVAKEQKKAESDVARLAAIDAKLLARKAAAKAKLAETLD